MVIEEHGSLANMLPAGMSQTHSDISLKHGAGLLPPLSISKGQFGKEQDIVWSCLYSKYSAIDWEKEIWYHLEPFLYASCTESGTRPEFKVKRKSETKRSALFNATVGSTRFSSVPACLCPGALLIPFCGGNQHSKEAGTGFCCATERVLSTCRALLPSSVLTQVIRAWHVKGVFM